MWSSNEDGGAFAECFFAQYPLGMGKKPLPFAVTDALTSKQVGSLRSKTALSTQAAPCESLSCSFPALGALVAVPTAGKNGAVVAVKTPGPNDADELAQTTEKTKEALEQVLRSRQAEKEDFSENGIRRKGPKKPVMEIVLPGDVGVAGSYDPAPIVRSPVRKKKDTGDGEGEDGSSSILSSLSNVTSVPFSIGNWKNKRKLIIPLEQRLAHQDNVSSFGAGGDGGGGGGGISDNVMQLAMAMQKARKEIEEEQAAREKAQQEEKERRQAEREAEATQHAKELLEKAAVDMMQAATQRRKETREERLERIRLERELREREKEQESRQRRLAKAAARLGITVEALEADEELLKTVDDAAGSSAVGVVDSALSHANYHATTTRASAVTSSGVGQNDFSMDPSFPSLYADNDEDSRRPAGGIRKGVFGSAVISNEGIRCEMEALAKLEKQQSGVIKDGLSLERDDNGGSSDDDDDDDDGLGMSQLMKKKRRF